MKEFKKFTTKHDLGFTSKELYDLLDMYPNINTDKVYNALRGNTCAVIDNEVVMYRWDIETAIQCGLENRDLTIEEWD